MNDPGKLASQIEESKEAQTGIVPRDIALSLQKENIKLSNKDKKDVEKLMELNFAYCGESMITMWHRPSKSQIRLLKEILGITLVVTVQRESEMPKEIAQGCKSVGIKHLHIELEGANKPLLENPKT